MLIRIANRKAHFNSWCLHFAVVCYGIRNCSLPIFPIANDSEVCSCLTSCPAFATVLLGAATDSASGVSPGLNALGDCGAPFPHRPGQEAYFSVLRGSSYAVTPRPRLRSRRRYCGTGRPRCWPGCTIPHSQMPLDVPCRIWYSILRCSTCGFGKRPIRGHSP